MQTSILTKFGRCKDFNRLRNLGLISLRRTVLNMATRHRFVPLSQDGNISEGMQLKGIVFDMDGTLCEPQNYMFGQMRSEVGIPKTSDILDFIHALPEPEQSEAFAKIRAIESEAMSKQIPQAGLVSLMEYLDQRKIKKAICTRNFDAPVNHLLQEHIPSHIIAFGPVITREFRPPKPSPAGILHIARAWNIAEADVEEGQATRTALPIVMVGDSIDDMLAGRAAGALTVLLKSPGKEDLESHEATDVVIGRLDELIGLLEDGLRVKN